MAFELVNYGARGNLSLPDPQSMVMDWAGAFNTALNTALKMRQLGLENEWKERSAKLAEDNFLLRQEEARATISQAEANTKLQRDELTFKQKEYEEGAAIRAADLKYKQGLLEQMRMKNERDADSMAVGVEWASFVGSGQDNDFSQSQRTFDTNKDPIQRMEAADKMAAYTGDTGVRGYLTSVLNRTDDKLTEAAIVERLNSGILIQKARTDKIYDKGEPLKRYKVKEGVNVPALKALNNKTDLDLTETEKALVNSPEVEYEYVAGQTVRYSMDDLVAGIRNGKPDMARIFLKETATPETRQKAIDFMKQNYGGQKADLMLHDLTDDKAFKGEPTTLLPTLDALVSNTVVRQGARLTDKAQRVVLTDKIGPDGKRIEGYADIPGKTNYDLVMERWDIFSKSRGMPSEVAEMGRQRIQSIYDAEVAVNQKIQESKAKKAAEPQEAISRINIAAQQAEAKPIEQRTTMDKAAISAKRKLDATTKAEEQQTAMQQIRMDMFTLGATWAGRTLGAMAGESDVERARRETLRKKLSGMTLQQIMQSGDRELIDEYRRLVSEGVVSE